MDEVGEGAQRLVDRHVEVGSVQLVQVDAVGLQAAQRLFAGPHDVQPRVATIVGSRPGRVVHLGGNQRFVAPPALGQDPTDDPLGLAGAVAVGGVDQIDAGIESADDHAARLVLGRRVQDVVGAECEGRHHRPRVTEPSILHHHLAPYPASTLTSAPVM